MAPKHLAKIFEVWNKALGSPFVQLASLRKDDLSLSSPDSHRSTHIMDSLGLWSLYIYPLTS